MSEAANTVINWLSLHEEVERRSLLRSLTGLAALKRDTLAALTAASNAEDMRRGFATLRLVREMRKDRIAAHRGSMARYRRQAREHDEDEAYLARLRAGLTSPEEQAEHRRQVVARLQSGLAESADMLEGLSRKLEELRGRARSRRRAH